MDPVTVVQIIAAIYEKINEAKEKNEFKKWQQEINQKLNQILNNTNEILLELRNFRIQIEINLDERFRTYYLASLNASIYGLLNVLSGIKPKTAPNQRTKSRIIHHTDLLRNTLLQSLTYGYATIPMALTGYSLLLPAMDLAEISEAELEDTRQKMREIVFLPALDPMKEGSFAWTRDHLTVHAAGLRQDVVNALRPVTVGYIPKGMTPISNPLQPNNIIFAPFQAVCIDFLGDPDNSDSITNSNAWIVPTLYYRIEDLKCAPLPYAPLIPREDVNTRATTLTRMFKDWASQSLEEGKKAKLLTEFIDSVNKLI